MALGGSCPRGPAGTLPFGQGTLGCSLSSSMEMCDQRHNITMCPLCDKTCSYWKMSSACATARASHLFDNPATVFFSIFMALWGKPSAATPSVGQRVGPDIPSLSLRLPSGPFARNAHRRNGQQKESPVLSAGYWGLYWVTTHRCI